jgi:predicted ester cyclase
MKGFDAEFLDLDHYIRVITDRIWEGRRIDDIVRYYGADCAVETPASVSIGTQPVVDGTRATLLAFPDRRLLAEDVIVSGDEDTGFLSSHRIFSPMTHAGPGVFGPATGKPVFARTIADCVCINNRIVHEWLVRDQAAIARQIGLHERDLAQRWLDARGGFDKAGMPPAPAPYRSFIDTGAIAQSYAQGLQQQWAARRSASAGPTHHAQRMASLQATHSAQCITALPGANVALGLGAIANFWADLCGALTPEQVVIEHLVATPRRGRATALALRWRAHTKHTNHLDSGRYGPATGRAVEVMGITHADVVDGKVVREWLLIDDVAVWMQVLTPSNTSTKAAR